MKSKINDNNNKIFTDENSCLKELTVSSVALTSHRNVNFGVSVPDQLNQSSSEYCSLTVLAQVTRPFLDLSVTILSLARYWRVLSLERPNPFTPNNERMKKVTPPPPPCKKNCILILRRNSLSIRPS